jgi:hypothetical protein
VLKCSGNCGAKISNQPDHSRIADDERVNADCGKFGNNFLCLLQIGITGKCIDCRVNFDLSGRELR